MKIKLTRNTIVDGRACNEGDIVDASDKAAKYLTAIGKAELVEEAPVEKPEPEPIETAIPAEPEKAIRKVKKH